MESPHSSKPMANDDRTVVLRSPSGKAPEKPESVLEITYPLTDGGRKTVQFSNAFSVGRLQTCQIHITDNGVSREHLRIYPQGGRWWVEDVGSQNGSYLDGKPIQKLALQGAITLELGKDGPTIHLRALQAPHCSVPSYQESATEISRRYFDPSYTGSAGEHTLLVRRAFQMLARQQARRYWGFIALVTVLFIGAGSTAIYQYLQIQKTNEIAIDIFYNMKTLELQIANLEATLSESAKAAYQLDIAVRKQQLAELRKRYEDFISQIGPSGRAHSDVDRIILHVAQLFGECELNMPDGFVDEVKRYIERWKATPRLESAIRRLNENRYLLSIYQTLTSNELPPQFLYIALQESSFQEQAVGPRTRYGFAKGMWQFIPDTGLRYGLRPGPLRELAEYDPQDERHHFEKATQAAAKYIKDIYRTDAQASGMLVMASYNWGEGNVIRLIRQMPENPRERNFWQLLQHYPIPQETYDYVFYIFSAAVIGENPRLFGFTFDNPLQGFTQATGVR